MVRTYSKAGVITSAGRTSIERRNVLAANSHPNDELEFGKLGSRLAINRIPQTCYISGCTYNFLQQRALCTLAAVLVEISEYRQAENQKPRPIIRTEILSRFHPRS